MYRLNNSGPRIKCPCLRDRVWTNQGLCQIPTTSTVCQEVFYGPQYQMLQQDQAAPKLMFYLNQYSDKYHLTLSVQSQCCDVAWSQTEICPKGHLHLKSYWVESKQLHYCTCVYRGIRLEWRFLLMVKCFIELMSTALQTETLLTVRSRVTVLSYEWVQNGSNVLNRLASYARSVTVCLLWNSLFVFLC